MPGQFPMILIMIAAGALFGLGLSEAWLMNMMLGETRWLAMALGGLIGALFAIVIQQGRRIEGLEKRLDADQPHQPTTRATAAAAATTQPETSAAPTPKPAAPTAQPSPSTAPKPTSAKTAQKNRPSPFIEWIRRWFSHGNVPVKIGVLVTFVAVAALLRYASEQGWLSLSIEVRLVLVALSALAAMVFGWTRRYRQRIFALSLQGGAIGVLLLTIYAAFDLYQLIPSQAALALTLVLVAAGGVLAMAQQAMALAVLAMIAGYAAPLLMGADQGNHIALFSWYAILNLAVFALAWKQSWPVLNRIGFVFTFVIAWIWGVLAWTPDHYASAQGFLILFFLLYLAIPIIEAMRRPEHQPARLDIILVFGLPLFAFPLQIGLLEGDRLMVAISALAAGIIYLIAGWWLIRQRGVDMLARSHAVLALGLATLAVPFAFSGPTIAMIWALEGAALVWYGCHQQRRLVRLAGLGLQLTAAAVWLVNHGLGAGGERFLINPLGFSGLALAFAALFSAWCYARASAQSHRVNLLAAWGLALWSLNGFMEAITHLQALVLTQTLIALAGLTTLLAAGLSRWQGWWVSAPACVLALVVCIPLALAQSENALPLTGWGAAVWLLVVVAVVVSDHIFTQQLVNWRIRIAMAGHAAVFFMLGLVGIDLANIIWGLDNGWQWLFGALPVLLLAAWLSAGTRPPLCVHPLDSDDQVGFATLTATVIAVGLIASLAAPGGSDPLPWLPILNPLELGQLAAVMVLLVIARRSHDAPISFPLPLAGLLLLAVASAMGLRAVHQLAGVPWDLFALFEANTAQAALSVIWTVFGVSAWIAGSRMKSTPLWWAGAILLGIVLLKLLIIDRQFLSTAAGILSFMAFGLLSIAVGYLAPAPPSARDREKSA